MSWRARASSARRRSASARSGLLVRAPFGAAGGSAAAVGAAARDASAGGGGTSASGSVALEAPAGGVAGTTAAVLRRSDGSERPGNLPFSGAAGAGLPGRGTGASVEVAEDGGVGSPAVSAGD